MKKVSPALTLIAVVFLVSAASPMPIQSVETHANDIFGSHDLSIYPRPTSTSITSFRADPHTLIVYYKYAGNYLNSSDYVNFFRQKLPGYHWVNLETSTRTENIQEISATASGWLKDNGLDKIEVTIGIDGLTVRADMNAAYCNNECVLYWSKFFTN